MGSPCVPPSQLVRVTSTSPTISMSLQRLYSMLLSSCPFVSWCHLRVFVPCWHLHVPSCLHVSSCLGVAPCLRVTSVSLFPLRCLRVTSMSPVLLSLLDISVSPWCLHLISASPCSPQVSLCHLSVTINPQCLCPPPSPLFPPPRVTLSPLHRFCVPGGYLHFPSIISLSSPPAVSGVSIPRLTPLPMSHTPRSSWSSAPT